MVLLSKCVHQMFHRFSSSPGAVLVAVVYEDMLCSRREDSAMSALSSATGWSDWAESTASLWAEESDNEWAGPGRSASWGFPVTMETSEIKGCCGE